MESLLAKQIHRSVKVFIFTWNENWKSSWRRVNLRVCAGLWCKLSVFLHKDVEALRWKALSWCICRWNLRYSFLPMPGEEQLGGRVCLGWWNLWLPRTWPETARKSNVAKSFVILVLEYAVPVRQGFLSNETFTTTFFRLNAISSCQR